MNKKIYISPSNQFANTYATGNTNEKEQCHKIAKYCVAYLEKAGFDVMCTYNDDMYARVRESNAFGAALHIAIHTNATAKHNVTGGTQILLYSLEGERKKIGQAVYNELAPLTVGESAERLIAMPSFYEIKTANATTIYCECEFHDTKEGSDFIIKNTQKIGEAIAKGICNHYGVKVSGSTAEKPKEETVTETAKTGIKTYKKNANVKLSDNFTVKEFACHGNGCCDTVKVDLKLVTFLQKIRNHFKAPITINSGYRCSTHNRNVGGASGSYHTKGMAADIVVKGVKPAEVAKYAESIGVRGIGLYETDKDGYFVHIDTRTSKSFWYGQGQAYRSTFGGAVSNSSTTTKREVCKVNLPILRKGDKGEEVRAAQILLNGRGYNCGSADGDFGAKTDNAVRAYQKAKKLGVDGVIGADTWESLLGA